MSAATPGRAPATLGTAPHTRAAAVALAVKGVVGSPSDVVEYRATPTRPAGRRSGTVGDRRCDACSAVVAWQSVSTTEVPFTSARCVSVHALEFGTACIYELLRHPEGASPPRPVIVPGETR